MKYQKVSDLPLPSENLVYYISCRWCLLLYTFVKLEERSLKSRFIEHLRSIRKNTPGFSVAQHFNSTDHSISDVQVRGVALCSGSNFQRKQRVRLILQLGSVQLKGLNINFSFIWIWTLYTSCACYYAHVCLDCFYDVYDIVYYCTTVFFSHRSKKAVINPKRLCFWKHLTLWYFFTEHHLISYSVNDWYMTVLGNPQDSVCALMVLEVSGNSTPSCTHFSLHM